MIRKFSIFFCIFALWAGLFVSGPARAEETAAETEEEPYVFTDTRFQGLYTTENLDAILAEYDLNDGWFWVTPPNVRQDYHGHENMKGWTETSSRVQMPFNYTKGWYGSRWDCESIDPFIPNASGTGECFGFAQFICYLLSGSRNPQGEWVSFRFVNEAKGLKVGDIVRVEYQDDAGLHQHSAVVYSVDGDKVTYLQVSGSVYNKLRIRVGYMGGNEYGSTSLTEVYNFKGLHIMRAEENLDGVYPWDWPQK